MKKEYIITVDMGGTKILGALLNSEDGIIKRVKEPTDPGSNEKQYINALTNVINNVVQEAGINNSQVKAVALGVPGSVNPFTGIIGTAPNLGLKNFNVKEKLEKKINFPVLIENDVNLGALGIKAFGLGKDSKNMFAMFIGTGIGGALVCGDQIYRGATYVAGEIGHVVVEKGGPLCGCGKHGCFEAVASRTAVVRNIVDDINNGKKSVLSSFVKNGERIKSKALANAVKKEDKVAVKRLSESCEYIGLVLANITTLLNFDLIVLGGGVIEAMDDFMLPKIIDSFNEHVFKDSAKGVKILASKLGDDAAIYGGIPLAEEFLSVKI